MGKDYLDIIEEKHIDLFCEVFGIEINDIQDLYVNPGRSANNENFVFVVNNESFLYRIPGLGTDKFCSRTREAKAYRILKPYKITDEVIYISEETGIKISKYYENSKIPSNGNKKELEGSMDILKRLHELNIDFPYTDTLFDRMKRYRQFALEVGGEKYYLEGFEDYYNKILEFEKNIEKYNIKKCFTHGDASINNLLITNEYDYPLLIDLEFPAMGTAYDDIATFCIDADYRKEDILMMAEYYLKRKPTLEEQYITIGLCTVAAMMWYSWATYKCAVEDDNELFLDFRNDYHRYLDDVYPDVLDLNKKINGNK